MLPKKIIVVVLFAAAAGSVFWWHGADKPERKPSSAADATFSTAHPWAPTNAAPASAMPTQKVDSVETMTEGLRARLDKEPNDVNGWVLLARSYHYLERWDDAKAAFAKARALGYQGDSDMNASADASANATANTAANTAAHAAAAGDAIFNDIGRVGAARAEAAHAAATGAVQP